MSQNGFRQIPTKFSAKLKLFFHITLKYGNLGITPVKSTKIVRNSEKNRRNFDEKLQNLPSLSKINKNFVEFCKNGAKVLKNHRNLEWCKGKNVDLAKSFPTSIYLQNVASIQPRTSLRKVQKMYAGRPRASRGRAEVRDRVGRSPGALRHLGPRLQLPSGLFFMELSSSFSNFCTFFQPGFYAISKKSANSVILLINSQVFCL